MTKIHTHYDNLGVTRNAQPEIITAAYQTLRAKYAHATDAESVRILGLVEEAYRVLSSPISRAEHDRWIAEQEQPNPYQQDSRTPLAPQPASTSSAPVVTVHTPVSTKSSTGLIVLLSLLMLVVLLVVAVLAFKAFSQNKTSEVKPYAPTPQVQELPMELTEVQLPQNEEKSEAEQEAKAQQASHVHMRNKAKQDYDTAVKRINAVWNSLHPSTREYLRAEQRMINAEREATCKAQAVGMGGKYEQEAYRYNCEVQQLNDRTQYLRTQVNVVYDDGSQDYEPIYVEQEHQALPEPQRPPQNNNRQAAVQARAEYEAAVASINAVWDSLEPSVRDAIRDEQKSVNRSREAHCKHEAQNYSDDRHTQDVYRYECEVEMLGEREAYLRDNYY